MITRRQGLALMAGGLALPGQAAFAQPSFPDQPVKMIVPFAPGGPADTIARLLGQAMGERLHQAVVVDSRSGAGGMVGVEAAARSRPDGLTTVLASTGALVILPQLVPRMAYDAQKDLAPIIEVLSVPQVLVLNRKRGISSVAELVALARRAPGKLTYGSAGNGSSLHMAGELFRLKAGIEITHVPYRGAGPAVTDLLAGTIDMLLADVPVVLPHLREGGDLVGLAVTAQERAAVLPDLPTMAEAGLPGVLSDTWYALFAPAATPPERLATLHRAASDALADAGLRRSLIEQGGILAGGSPQDLAALLVSERAKWAEVIRVAGIRLE